MSEDDLIRRGDVLRLFEPRKGECYGDCTQRCAACGATRVADAVRALPADPRADAAIRLAEAAERFAQSRERVRERKSVDVRAVVDEHELALALAAWREIAEKKPEPACTCVGMAVPWHDAKCPRTWTPENAAAAFAQSVRQPRPAPRPCDACEPPNGDGDGLIFPSFNGRDPGDIPDPIKCPTCAECGGSGLLDHDFPGIRGNEFLFMSDCKFRCGAWMGSHLSGPGGLVERRCPKRPCPKCAHGKDGAS